MDIKCIENILNLSLKAKDDAELKKQYAEALTKYLTENKLSDEILTIITRGMDIDQGANYFEFVESLPKEELASAWKDVKNNKTIKANKSGNGLKVVAGLFSLGLMNEAILESQQHHIFNVMMTLIERGKKENLDFGGIIKEYVIDAFHPNFTFPKWEKLKLSGKVQKDFAQMIINLISNESKEEYKSLNVWVQEGLKSAEAQLEKERIEAKVPRSRIDELQSILEHYKLVEKQVRRDVYEIDRLEKKAESLQKEISRLQGERSDLISKTDILKANLKSLEEKLDKAEQIITEHKALNDSFSSVKKQDEMALLNDIADEISAEYKDFKESQADDMDIVLGEIYREKLKNVFRILERKGIKME